MPSSKPLIALRLPTEMHSKIVQLAAAEDRSVTNFIEHQLRRLLDVQLKPVFTPAQLADIKRHDAKQMDITEAIAAAVKRGPVVPRRRRRV